MKNIILDWLNDDLKLDVTQKYMTGSFKNGVLIARILNSYKIINDRILDEIKRGAETQEYLPNLIKLSYWLKLLGISCSLGIINDIIAGKGTTIMQIMYQLYLTFNTRMHRKQLGDIEKRQEEYSDWCDKNVKVEKSSTAESGLQHQDLNNDNLNTEMAFQSLTESKNYRHKSKIDDNVDGYRSLLKFSFFHKNCTSTDQEESSKIDAFDHSKTSSSYTTLIKNKLVKEAGRVDMKTRLNKNIMNQVWKTIDRKCKELDNSQYLSQTLSKINNESSEDPNNESLHQQQYADNEQIDWAKRDAEQSYVSDEIKRAWSYNFNKNLELHRHLWNKRIKQQKRCRYKLCKEIIEDCIDSAIERSEKSLKNGILSRSDDNDDDKRVSTKVHSTQSNLELTSEIPILNVMTRKYQRHEECNYNEYIYLTGDWFDRNLLAVSQNVGDDGDNNNIVLGSIIHSLFDSDDARLKSSKMFKYPISCAVSNSPNAGIIRKGLQSALAKSSILVVDRETAIDYCKKFYLESVSRPPSSKGDKSKKGRNNNAKKLSKKSIRNKSIPKFKDQEVQVDGVPDADDLNYLNECIKNGKEVNDCLKTKSFVGNDLLVKCIVSVLKSHQHRMRGWVALNFPSSFEETCLFENYLAGNLGRNTSAKRNSHSENVRSSFQAESSDSSVSSDTHSYHSILIPNLYFQAQYGQHDNFITKFISMMQNEKRPVEERGREHIDRRESKSVNLETHFKKLGFFHEFQYDKLDKQMVINLAHCIIADTVVDENFEYPIDENALTLSLDIGRPTSTKKSKKNPQNPEVDPFLPDQKKMPSGDFNRNFKPGDENWTLVDCSLSYDMRLNLIQLWQLTESSYLNSLETIFSSVYQIEEKFNLYWSYVEGKVKHVLFDNKERNSELQHFTEKYNNIQGTQNQSTRVKMATDCDALTSQLRFKLWNLSDLKRRDAEDIIARLLDDSTAVVAPMKHLWNIISLLMHVEMKRLIDTLTILQYYYSTALKVKTVELISNFDKVFEELLSNKIDEPDWEDNNSIEIFILKNSDLFIGTAQELAKQINNSRKKLEIDLAKSTSIFALAVSKISALLIEWEAATHYEIQRFIFRINLIKRKVLFDIVSMNDRAKGLHLELSSLVEKCFLQDNNCCSNFSAQIDKAHSQNIFILGSLDLIGNEYYIRGNPGNCAENKREPGLVSSSSKYFTMTQLEKMTVHLRMLAPSGRMDRISLSFLLDDWNNKKSNRMLPDDWSDLTRQQIYDDILEPISAQNETVDWKNFLLHGTLQAYPSKEELLTQYRIFQTLDPQQLGTISFEDFANNNSLWFGSNEIDRLKKLLFWIFKTGDDKFDYRSFLMKLCKDEDPAIGFGKALSLNYNRCVVVTNEDINYKRKVEDSRDCSLKIAKQILDQVVLDVINLTECAILYEYHDCEQGSVPLWRKLGRLPIGCPFKSFASPLPATEKENHLINRLRKLDWTNHVPTKLFVRILEEGRDAMHMQCSENFNKLFNDNCTRLKEKEFINFAHILRKDAFVVDQISKDTRFKAIYLPNLINKDKYISM